MAPRTAPARLDGSAPVQIFVMGIDQWRDEQDWPLPDTSYVSYYLHSSGRANTAAGDGALGTDAPARTATDTYLYDPRRPVPTLGGRIMLPPPRTRRARSTSARSRPATMCCASPAPV